MSTLLFCLFTGSASAQQAADWQFQAGAVFSPDPAVTWMSQSVGSPSVVYDSIRDRFLMVFESKTPTVDARCPQGVWTIGLAQSADGITWDPAPYQVLYPTPGNGKYFSCVAAHPTALFDPTLNGGNGGLVIWFKAEQDTDACATATPSWGCGTYTGIGRARMFFDAAGFPNRFTVSGSPVIPASAAPSMGFPKVVKAGGSYQMLFQQYPDIWSAEGVNINSWTVSAAPEIAVSDYRASIPWLDDEFFNPSLVCGEPDPLYPFKAFVGARDTRFGAIIDAGWSTAVTDLIPGGSWFLATDAQQTWADDVQWRHFDVIALDTGEYLVWFSEKDASGNNFIRFGGTTLTFNNADVRLRLCP